MRKLIHSSFELDLSIYKINVVRENHWFSDNFFTKYSFPFEIEISDEIDTLMGFISRYTSTDIKTYLNCTYCHNDVMEDAVFEIDQSTDKLSCIVYFGYDQLPNFEKKLSQLPLDSFELPIGTNIYQHAKTIITQTWPAVTYNFPQIHTDKIDPTTDDVYAYFEKIINNYKNGDFLINEVITADGVSTTYNRNIMQPLPYWLHILQKGFQDVGLTLAGDIVTDPHFQKMLLFGDVEYNTTVEQQSISIYVKGQDKTSEGIDPGGTYGYNHYYTYSNTYPITNPGKYRIIGTVRLWPIVYVTNYIIIKYRGIILWQLSGDATDGQLGYPYLDYDVNIIFETLVDLNPNFIQIISYQSKPDSDDDPIFQLDINPIRLHDDQGNAIPNIINKNEVVLTRAVPDITFGDFIKVIKNWFNYDLEVNNDQAIMNKIENSLDYTNAIDLSEHEVKYPVRKYQKGLSFLLKFQDADTKDYKFLPVFQDSSSVVNSNYTTDDKTQTIEINALPLPLATRLGIQTAYALETNNSKCYAVLYTGLTAGLNIAQDPTEINMPAVHVEYYKNWFQSRINASEFTWTFKMFTEKFVDLTPKSKVYAYGKYHVVKSINDTEVNPDDFDIELTTASLE